MSSFKLTDFSIKAEAVKSEKITISELDADAEFKVDQFRVSSFKGKSGVNNYSEVKDKFGPLAATDPEREIRSQRDRRFSINALLRDPLSIEAEEQRAMGEKIKVLVDEIAVEAKRVAEESGYAAGLKRGTEEGLLQVQGQANEGILKFQQMVKEMETSRADIFRENEAFLISIIFRIAKMVTLRELSVDREYLLRLTKELVENVGVQDNTVIKLNSEDEKFITAIQENLFKSFGEMRNLNIEVSSKVARGGCRIQTEWNAIDVNIEEQFKRIEQAMVGKTAGEA